MNKRQQAPAGKHSNGETHNTDRPRRQIVQGLTVAAGAAMLSPAAHAVVSGGSDCEPADTSASAARFPQHAVVFDHHGRKLRFYNDLIKNKVVMVHFMSTALEGDYQTAENLAKLQTLLQPRLGRDVYMLSITVDPQVDTIERLNRYAAQHSAQPGWSFITGNDQEIQSIKDALFFRPGGHAQHHDQQDCSMGLIRYGNDAANIWGSVPTRTDPVWLAQRLDWISPRKDIPRTPVRGGPPVSSV